MNNDLWYYLDGQDRKGPFSHEVMRQLLQAGVIQPETWVARQGDADWGPAAALLASAPPSANSAPATPTPRPVVKRGNSKWVIVGVSLLVLIFLVFAANRTSPRRSQPSVESEIERIFGSPGNSSYQGVSGQGSGGVCGNCGGSGRSGHAMLSCPSCSGRGTGTTPSGYAIVCNRCGGSGNIQMTCEVCGGSGRTR